MMNIKGKLLEISSTQQVKDSFRKREFVLEYSDNPQYPEFLKFEAIQNNCDQLDQFSEGDDVNVFFNLKGRKWTDPKGEIKYFNSLQAWKVERATDGNQSGDQSDMSQEPKADESWMSQTFSEDDDLPF